jgi:hypothetical protein
MRHGIPYDNAMRFICQHKRCVPLGRYRRRLRLVRQCDNHERDLHPCEYRHGYELYFLLHFWRLNHGDGKQRGVRHFISRVCGSSRVSFKCCVLNRWRGGNDHFNERSYGRNVSEIPSRNANISIANGVCGLFQTHHDAKLKWSTHH